MPVEGRVMRREEIETVLAEWLEGWKLRDPAAIAANYSEDCVYASMLAGTVRGRDAVESLYRSWFSAFPEMVFEVEARIIDGAQAAVFWAQRGRHVGDFCGLAGTGRNFQLQGVFLMSFKEGLIERMQSIYDFTGFLLQVGVLKAKPAI